VLLAQQIPCPGEPDGRCTLLGRLARHVARRASIAIVLACCVSGCGGSPTEPPWDGFVRVAGTVRDFRTSAAVAGARVTIAGATGTTDAGGAYTLTVEAGEQTVSIDGATVATVNLKDRTYRGDFFVAATGCIARYGTVIDSLTRFSVAGASVSLSGTTGTTDQTGWFRLNLGCSGELCLGFNTTFASVSHPNYVTGSFVAGRGVCGVSRVDYELTPR